MFPKCKVNDYFARFVFALAFLAVDAEIYLKENRDLAQSKDFLKRLLDEFENEKNNLQPRASSRCCPATRAKLFETLYRQDGQQ
jgi:hypothetical protein